MGHIDPTDGLVLPSTNWTLFLAVHITEPSSRSMAKQSAVEVGTSSLTSETIKAQEQSLQNRNRKRRPNKKPAVNDEPNQKPLQGKCLHCPHSIKAQYLLVDGELVIAGLARNSHRIDPSDFPQPCKNPDDAPKNDTEKQLVDKSRGEVAKASKWKVWKEKQKAKMKLLKPQQAQQDETEGQLMRTGQIPRALDAIAQSRDCLEKPDDAKIADVPEFNAGNPSVTITSQDCTGISTKRGLRKPHRNVKSTGQGHNGRRGNIGSKAANSPPGSKPAELDPAAVQSTANAVVTTDKAKGKLKRPQKLSRTDRLAEQHEPLYARRRAEEGSESMYQQHNRIALNNADGSIRSAEVTTQTNSRKISFSCPQTISKCSNINVDHCAVYKRESDIVLTSTAHSDVNQSLPDVLGKQSLGFEPLSHTSCIPYPSLTGDHRPLSEPSYSSAKLDTTISGKVSSVPGNPNRKLLPSRFRRITRLVILPALAQI